MIHKQSERDTYGQHFRARFGTQRGSSPVPSGQWPNWRSFAPLAPICLGRQKWSTRCCTVRIDIIVRHMISYCYIARIYPTRSLICASFYLRYVPGLPNERYLVRSLDWSLPRPGLEWTEVEWSGVEWDGVCAYHMDMDMDMDWTIAKPFCHLSLRVWVIGTIMRYNRRRYCCKSKHIVTLMTTKVAHITVFNCVPRSLRDSRWIVFGQSKSIAR